MEKELLKIQGIPALRFTEKDDTAQKAYLFVHGKCGSKDEAEAFARLACPRGYDVIGIDLPEHGERKAERTRLTPWTTVPELRIIMAYLMRDYTEISLRANSIGAWLCMMAFQDAIITNSLFVSPILDMQNLIQSMMNWACVTEEQLKAAGEIPTTFGETLSWEYLMYVKEHPIVNWHSKTHILYATKDSLTPQAVANKFVSEHDCDITVMENGEHYFHTEEQLAVLRNWEQKLLRV